MDKQIEFKTGLKLVNYENDSLTKYFKVKLNQIII